MAVRLKAEEVGHTTVTAHLHCDGDWTVVLSNRALSAAPGLHDEPDVVITFDRSVLVELSSNTTTIEAAIEVGRATATGDVAALAALFGHLDTFQSMFPIVEP